MSKVAKVLCEGVYFGEGPRWKDGRLWFSDFYAQAVKSVSPSGDLREEFKIDDRPSGLGWMPDGSLLVVSMTKRQVLRRTSDGKVSVHADLGKIATFHCNDMVVDKAGGAYVGNFGFDLHADMSKRGDEAVIADHPVAKLARINANGEASVAAEDMHFPNGSVITPDGKTLIVGETLGGCLTAFDIGPDGALSGRRALRKDMASLARRHLPRRQRLDLDREPLGSGMRPIFRGWRSARRRPRQSELLCMHARR